MTYLVMETNNGYCIVLDEAGRFIKAANFNYEVGQTLEHIHELTTSAPRSGIRKFSAALASIAAIIALFFGLRFYQGYMTTFASVYLQINPEVRIDVNRNDQVVGIEAINEDGQTLIQGYEYNRKKLDSVTDDLIDLAIAKGYLSEGGTVTVRLDAPDEEWFLNKGIGLRQSLSTHLQEKMSVTIQILKFSSDESDYIAPILPHDDSGYDDSLYEEGDSDYRSEYGDDSDYDDSDYGDHSDYDDSDYGDHSDYDDSDYDDHSGYDDSDYDD